MEVELIREVVSEKAESCHIHMRIGLGGAGVDGSTGRGEMAGKACCIHAMQAKDEKGKMWIGLNRSG